MMKSKLHRATVTDANLSYAGSISLDGILMRAANLLPHEKVEVLNINNGERFATYVIEGLAGSGEVCINGAAARLVQPGDKVIVVSYGEYEEAELVSHEPTVLLVDGSNRPLSD